MTSQFLCSLDGSAFQDCGSGRSGLWNGRNIPHGQHVFTVKERDTNGNVGEPVQHTFNAGKHGNIITLRLIIRQLQVISTINMFIFYRYKTS